MRLCLSHLSVAQTRLAGVLSSPTEPSGRVIHSRVDPEKVTKPLTPDTPLVRTFDVDRSAVLSGETRWVDADRGESNPVPDAWTGHTPVPMWEHSTPLDDARTRPLREWAGCRTVSEARREHAGIGEHVADRCREGHKRESGGSVGQSSHGRVSRRLGAGRDFGHTSLGGEHQKVFLSTRCI